MRPILQRPHQNPTSSCLGTKWDATWWGGRAWYRRSWSGLDWQQSWGHEASHQWWNNRGWSRSLSAEYHPGWGQEDTSEQQHAAAALQRQATSEMEQTRPTPLSHRAAVLQQAAFEEARATAPVKEEPSVKQEFLRINGEMSGNHEVGTAEQQQGDKEQQGGNEAQQNGNPAQNTDAADHAKDAVPPANLQNAAGPDQQQAGNQQAGNPAQNTGGAQQQQAGNPAQNTGGAQQQQAGNPAQNTGGADHAKGGQQQRQQYDASNDPDSWRKDKRGFWLNPHALYMRFYRSVRSTVAPIFIIHLLSPGCFMTPRWGSRTRGYEKRVEAEGSSYSEIIGEYS